MSSVRGMRADGVWGYGVDGSLAPRTFEPTIYFMPLYLDDIPYATIDADGVPYKYALVSFTWRFRMKIVNADFLRVKIFNQRNDRGMWGEYWTAHEGSFSSQGFTPFQTFVSPLNACAYLVDLSFLDEPLQPSDQPRFNLSTLIYSDVSLQTCTQTGAAGFGGSTSPNGGSISAILADSIGFYPNDPLTEYVQSLTYAFRIMYYTQQQFDLVQQVVIGL